MADNTTINWITVLVSLGSSLITAWFANFLTRGKTNAETAKILAETEQIKVSTEQSKAQLTALTQHTTDLSKKIDASLSGSSFEIQYYGMQDPTGFDFTADRVKNWDSATQKETGKPAGGNFTITGKMLNIERTDNEGRFALVLNSYTRDSQTMDYIKADPSLSSKRKIRVSCEAKSLSGTSHVLDFVIRDKHSYDWLNAKTFTLTAQSWTPLESSLLVGPDKDFYLKIYDRDVAKTPSSIQIQNLKVVEVV